VFVVAERAGPEVVEQLKGLGRFSELRIGLGEQQHRVGHAAHHVVKTGFSRRGRIGLLHLVDVPLVDGDASGAARALPEVDEHLVALAVGSGDDRGCVPASVAVLIAGIVEGGHHADSAEHLAGSSVGVSSFRRTALRVGPLGLVRSYVSDLPDGFGGYLLVVHVLEAALERVVGVSAVVAREQVAASLALVQHFAQPGLGGAVVLLPVGAAGEAAAVAGVHVLESHVAVEPLHVGAYCLVAAGVEGYLAYEQVVEGAGHALGGDASLSEVVHQGLHALEFGYAFVEYLEARGQAVFVGGRVLDSEGYVAVVAHELIVAVCPEGAAFAVELGPVVGRAGLDCGAVLLLLGYEFGDAVAAREHRVQGVELRFPFVHGSQFGMQGADTSVARVVFGIVLHVGAGVVPVVVASSHDAASVLSVAPGEGLEGLVDGRSHEGIVRLGRRADRKEVPGASRQKQTGCRGSRE